MTAQAFIDIVTADLKRADEQIERLQRKRRFAAHMIDAAETFRRNNSPTPAERLDTVANRLRETEELIARLNAKAST